jgi:hypothetical protein
VKNDNDPEEASRSSIVVQSLWKSVLFHLGAVTLENLSRVTLNLSTGRVIDDMTVERPIMAGRHGQRLDIPGYFH